MSAEWEAVDITDEDDISVTITPEDGDEWGRLIIRGLLYGTAAAIAVWVASSDLRGAGVGACPSPRVCGGVEGQPGSAPRGFLGVPGVWVDRTDREPPVKHDKGFRLPEPRDKAIQWPARDVGDPITAIYYRTIRGWLVPGVERAFLSPYELVHQFGNDWYVISIQRVPERVS